MTVSHQQAAAGSLFVIKDPISGEFYRLGEAEQFIAEQLDGETPLEVVRQRTEAKFGATLPGNRLTAFIQNLERNGLLHPEQTPRENGGARQGRMRGSLLYLRFPLFDPDQLLSRLLPRARFFFTWQFLALSAALILLGMWSVVGNWGALVQDLSGLYRLSTIPLFLAVAFVVASAHEFAHGVTCKRFGGEVHEMGFMLIYFQPALYCNVSDAWLFPEKAKRLWVGFAGPYFELFLWALATLAWRLTEVDTSVNHLALIVMMTSGIWTLLNFNPLIKLDGYYLLSDYLELPNLRKKSFRYLGGVIDRVFGFRPQVAHEASRRQRTIYLCYGLMATVFSVGLMAYVLVTVGGLLIETQQPVPLMLLTGLVGVRLRRRVGRLFGTSSALSDSSDDDGGGDPATTVGSTVEPKRKWSRRRIRRVRWAALAGAALAVVFLVRWELRVSGPFSVLPEENADVRAAVEGIIQAINVDEGQQVRAGDVIAQLSNETLLASLRQTEGLVRETGANLSRLEAGPTAEQIELARAGVAKAADQLDYARNRLARLSRLLAENLLSPAEFEDAQERVTAAENEVAEANGQLNLLLRGARREEIDAARARLDQLEAQRSFLEEELKHLNVVSPVTGIVATPSRQLKEMERQLVAKGALIAKVYDLSAVAVHLQISEKDIADVAVGQQVQLRARAHPHVTLYGTVTSIGTSAAAGGPSAAEATGTGIGASQTFLVTTRIDNRALLLKPGMTGRAKISCGQKPVVNLIMRRLARTLKVEVWSWW